MQLLMLAAFHEKPSNQALQLAAELLPQLSQGTGTDFIRVFFVYLLTTQEQRTVKEFAQKLKEHSAYIGGNDIMSYAEELLLEGEAKGEARGEIKGKVETIKGFIKAGVDWAVIIEATGIDEDEFNRLKEQLAELQKGNNN